MHLPQQVTPAGLYHSLQYKILHLTKWNSSTQGQTSLYGKQTSGLGKALDMIWGNKLLKWSSCTKTVENSTIFNLSHNVCAGQFSLLHRGGACGCLKQVSASWHFQIQLCLKPNASTERHRDYRITTSLQLRFQPAACDYLKPMKSPEGLVACIFS